jgi:acetoacetate decarboxylase
MNNIPIHAPLYTPDLSYGSDDCQVISVLVEASERDVREILRATPFDFVSRRVWIELVVLRSAYGVTPFASGGVIVPARHPASGITGGYYAFCYIDTDEGLALGREPFGYPKKLAAVRLEANESNVRGAITCPSASIEIDLELDARPRPARLAPRYPHLLLQVFPSAGSSEPLLKRVLSRDTGAASRFEEAFGEGTIRIRPGSVIDELGWLEEARPVASSYARGQFRSAYGKVLETLEVGEELRRAIAALPSLSEFATDFVD